MDQAKEEGLKLHQSSDSDEEDSVPTSTEEPTPTRRPRKHKEKGAPSTRVSGRLRGTPADDISLTRLSPERGRRGSWMNSERSISQTSGSTQKSPQHRDVPEKLRSGPRGRGTTKESEFLMSSENQTVQTNQQLSDSTTLSPAIQGSFQKITNVSSPHLQLISPLSSVPSAAASPAMDKNTQSSSSAACREESEEQDGEAVSETVQCSRRDRRASASSDSICSPEHHSEQDGQLSLSPTLASPNSRSPRKRQSAESEILKGLPEDSPSAKVLRKLPGRLVTVVEEKEPKRRRRGMSGSGGAHNEGSSEESEQVEPVQEPATHSSDGPSQTLKDCPPISVPTSLASSSPAPPPPPPPPQEQEQASSPLQCSPGRGHHPCSPTHHSPDMPVLRNLPVRRRLETESRMAAQLGEQFVGRGRGVDRRSALSPKKPETNLDKDSAAQSDSNVTNLISVKRKRGRPPKTPPRAPELSEDKKPLTQKTSPERSPPHSPKRKRGRPRKDSTTTTSSSPSSPSTGAPSSQEPNLSTSNVMPVTLPAVSKTSSISSPTLNPTSPSNAAEVSSKTDSETNKSTTSVLLSSMHEDSQNMSSSTSEFVDSQGDTLTSPNPVIACINSLTLQLPSPLIEPPTCTHLSPIHAEELTQMPVLSETSEITAFSEPSAVSVTTVEAEENSLATNEQIDPLQYSNTSTHVTSQPLHRTSTTTDSPQTFVEPVCNIAASPTATHPSSTQPSPPALTSGIEPESSSSKSEAPEASATLTLSTVQQSTPKSDQTSVPTSQLQITAIEAATDSALVSHKISSTSLQSPSTINQTSDSLSTFSYRDADSSPPQNMPVADTHEGHYSSKDEVVTEEEEEVVVAEEVEKIEVDRVAEDDAGENHGDLSQPKRRKLDSLPKEQTPSASGIASSNSDIETHDAPKSDQPVKPSEEETREDRETRASVKKQSISRQSSQESVRSSSPSSVSSSGTRSSQSKKIEDRRRPSKRKRDDGKSEKERTEEESDKRHQSNSSSSSDSEDSSIKRCLTRSAQKKLEKDGMSSKNDESTNRQRGTSDKKGQTTNTTEGESSGETCSRVTCSRKSAGPQSNTLASPEPEVLGKRCSALNAAAKLLAMRGRGPDTPSPNPKNKTAVQQSRALSSERSSKPKGKTGQDSPKLSNSKAGSGRQTPNQSTESPQSSSSARSTRQRPGSLVPPLETERVKKEEKKKASDQKEEGEDENRETRSSRGHSACSSISSERGAGSSRSRSSSNSSQRTHSLSSQSTEPTCSRSRAASSSSDTERGKSIRRKSDGGRDRESRKEKGSQKHDKPELSTGSSDGTPDRVLRSVAALAAAQARTPASNTRSSSTQHRHSKT